MFKYFLRVTGISGARPKVNIFNGLIEESKRDCGIILHITAQNIA